MTTYLVIAALFLACELLSFGAVFRPLATQFLQDDTTTPNTVGLRDFLKGLFERLVLTIALVNGLPQILIFFGAMKLGTRLTTDTTTRKFNDFFLLGNLYTVFLAIQYSIHLKPNAYIIQFFIGLIC